MTCSFVAEYWVIMAMLAMNTIVAICVAYMCHRWCEYLEHVMPRKPRTVPHVQTKETDDVVGNVRPGRNFAGRI